MTLRQRLYKVFYPLLMKVSRRTGKGKFFYNIHKTEPTESIYNFKVTLISGQELPLSNFKGKKLLLVNTASNCGFTNQFKELKELQKTCEDKVAVIGFPSNEFKEQEKFSDLEIAEFCQLNFGVNFPLAQKSRVLIKHNQNEVYKWLTQPEKNGWNNHQPDWNFSKYLIDEKGNLNAYFGPSFSPLGPELKLAIEA